MGKVKGTAVTENEEGLPACPLRGSGAACEAPMTAATIWVSQDKRPSIDNTCIRCWPLLDDGALIN